MRRLSIVPALSAGLVLAAAGCQRPAIESNLRGPASPPSAVSSGPRTSEPVAALAPGGPAIARPAIERIDLRANTYTGSAQSAAAVAADSSGRTVVVWQSRRQEQGSDGVYAQQFSPGGELIGGEIHVNSHTPGTQGSPVIAMDPAGNTWVAWESFGQDGDRGSIVARRFDANMNPLTPEIGVNDVREGHQAEPAIAALSDGGALVAWTSPSGAVPDKGRSVRIRPVGPSGNLGDVAALDPPPGGGFDRLPCAAVDARDQAVIVWGRSDAKGRPQAVLGQRLDGALRPVGPPFAVSPADGGMHLEPAVAMSRGGEFAVAWAAAHGGDYAVLLRRFDSQGVPGPIIHVEQGSHGATSGVGLAVAPDGRCAVAWGSCNDLEHTTGLFACVYGPAGELLVPPFRVSAASAGDQRLGVATSAQRLVFGRGGRLSVAWSGDAGLGDSSGAHLTLLDPRPTDAAAASPAPAPAPNAHRDRVPNQKPAEPSPDKHVAGTASAHAVGGAPSSHCIDSHRNHPLAANTAPALAQALAPEFGPTPHQPPAFNPQQAVAPFDRSLIAMERAGSGGEFGFIGMLQTPWNPPDPHMAVSAEHIVLITNGEIAFFDKAGNRSFAAPLENAGGFWGELGATNLVFDPEVYFDAASQRFFAAAIERTTSLPFVPFILLAVSDDADPNGTWHKYRFNVLADAPNPFIDSPNMAVTDDHVYVSTDFNNINQFIYIIDKAAVLEGAAPQTSVINIPGVRSFGLALECHDAPAQYLVEAFFGTTNQSLRLRSLTDPMGSQQMETFSLPVQSYRPPEDPPSLGTTSRIESFDARVWSCMYRNDSLWVTHHMATSSVTPVTRQRWYQIRMNGWPQDGAGTPEVAQWGEVNLGSQVRTFFGSIWADEHDNAALVFARSSPTEFVSIGRVTRLAGDPPGTMRPAFTIQESTSSAAMGSTSLRWGDYSMVLNDPVEPGIFWAHHEYVDETWRTWVARFALPLQLVDSSPCAGYIDPRVESDDGVTLNQGIDEVRLTFSTPVFGSGGAPVAPEDFVVTQTGAGSPPVVIGVDASSNPQITLTLDRPLAVREWTTITAVVENANGDPIDTAGNLGPGAREPDRIDLAFLPADIDQSGLVEPLDLLRFRQGVNGNWEPPCGPVLDVLDIDRSGAIAPIDLLRLRQLLTGAGSATQPWSGAALNNPQP